jgi:drug/metabolite transporter (DMT)-like permease
MSLEQGTPPKLAEVTPSSGPAPSQAWGCVLGNLVLPGLGTFLARRRVSGVLQLLISQSGFLLMLLWAISYVVEWLHAGEMPADLGAHFHLGLVGTALFFLAWIWSLASSVDVLLSSHRSGL